MATKKAKKDAIPKLSTTVSRDDVMGYGQIIEAVSIETGYKKNQVRNTLEAAQRMVAIFCKAKANNRAHFGRLGVFYSRMTKERQVNHPQKPGETVLSPAHLILRLAAGSHAKKYFTNVRPNWDSADEVEPK